MRGYSDWTRRGVLAAAVTAVFGFAATGYAADEAKPEVKKPKVEVVFCLDTTGSMGGLIDGAKAKIWAICNQIASGKPTPDLKVGLVAFRDRGDEYVTKVFDLTDDLDAIHSHLKGFKAEGGGDEPESVNEALHVSVNKIKWSEDKGTLKIIFLVGDAPPHMDYKDDVKYPETCKKAVEKNIIINSIQCGNSSECTKFWKDICAKAEGSYAAIPQDGGVVAVVDTPFDKRLAELNKELGTTCLVWGKAEQQRGQLAANMDATEKLDPKAAAERVAYQAKNMQLNAFDFADQVKQGKLKLEDVKKDELPKELQGKSVEEMKKYLADLEKKRTDLNKEVVELDKKRADYIAKKQAELAKDKKDSFDAQSLEMLRNQAKKYNIAY